MSLYSQSSSSFEQESIAHEASQKKKEESKQFCPTTSCPPSSTAKKLLKQPAASEEDVGKYSSSDAEQCCEAATSGWSRCVHSHDGVGKRTELRVQRLEAECRDKDQQIAFLRSILAQLADRVDSLERQLDTVNERGRQTDLDVVDLRRDFVEMADEVDRRFVLSRMEQQMDPTQLRCLGTFVGHQDAVWSLCGCEGAPFLFSGSSDHSVKVWDTRDSFQCLHTLKGHRDKVLCLCAVQNPNGSLTLFSGSGDGVISCWLDEDDEESESTELRLAARVSPFKGEQPRAICCMDFLKDANNITLVSGTYGRLLVHRPGEDGRMLGSEAVMEDGVLASHWVRDLRVDARKSHVYTVSQRFISMWDMERGRCVKSAETSSACLRSLLLCPADGMAVAGAADGTIQLLAMESLQSLGTLEGHTEMVSSLAPSPSSAGRVVSASHDCSLKIWDLQAGKCMQTLQKHDGPVTSLSLVGRRLFSGSLDATLKVWM